MNLDICPLAVIYGYRSQKNELSFIGRKGLISLSGRSNVIEKILRLCNGMNSVRDIINQLPLVGADKVIELLSICEVQGIVSDSRNLFDRFHRDLSNPPFFSYDHGIDDINLIMGMERLRGREGVSTQLPKAPKSNLLKIIRKRASVRQFQKGQIPIDQLSGLLNATYSVGKNGHWSVASGGALYPLDLYLVVPNDHQSLQRGIYRWNPEKQEVSLISDNDPLVWITKVFNTKDLLRNVACILCVAANLNRMISKYANRGYLLTLLEAGHAVQNTCLYCAEQGIGAVECCGFCDEMLARELGLHFPRESVITTVIMGIPEHGGEIRPRIDHEMADKVYQLKHNLVGDSKPIIDVFFWEPKIKGFALSQWGATATYRPVNGRVSASVLKNNRGFATGSTTNEAVIKALAEGFERYALQQYRVDQTASALSIREQFLDPRLTVPYTRDQYKMLGGVECFNPRKEIDWVFGYRETGGECVCVPTDLVFFAPSKGFNGRKFFYRSSSSGVAAHFDKRIAIKTALYELIERDAFCVTWYAKRLVKKIPLGSLPDQLRNRISCWENMGYTVSLLDITLDGPPVVLTMIWSDKKAPALFSGAGCRPLFLDAVDRAFSEAELMGITWHYRRSRRNIRMTDIKCVEDHGLFYLNPQKLTHLDWLLESGESKVSAKDFSGDINLYDPIVVDITPKEHASGLKVVRVLSEKLMPINFGYGTEHYGHRRMNVLGFKWSMRYPSTPHFFA